MSVAAAGLADAERGPRLAALDVVRGGALAAMVIYHFAFDVSAIGLSDADVVGDLGWRLFARSIAGTFLALVGVNLVLATRRGLRLRSFLRRLALIGGAAALVTIGTYWFTPHAFVFFGILHAIALASVLALPFLRLPVWLVAGAAVAVVAAPALLSHPVFDAPALWWVGLSTVEPISVDYVPLFPWFGVVLFGVVAGRLLTERAGDSAFARRRPIGAGGRLVALAGRWSLAIYLVHQPVLVGALTLVEPFLTPSRAVVSSNFMANCVPTCRSNGQDASTCTARCGCMFDGLYGTDLFGLASPALMTPDQSARWRTIVEGCLAAASLRPPTE
ncbi:MAG: heparan-alpha-glucosaminide N-acetyltransferase [Bauldia sp.]